MNFVLLYTHEEDLSQSPLSSFLDAINSRKPSLDFSVEANSMVSGYKTFVNIKVTDEYLNLVLNSTRGEPVRQFPAIIRVDKDLQGREISIAVLYNDDLLASDEDLLVQEL